MIANAKVLVDNQLRLTSNTTLQGAAQAKGTATSLQLIIIGGADGANAVAGTETVVIQGSNSTTAATFLTSGGAAIVPDKGTIANITVAGAQVVHLDQLQFAFYRVALSAGAATTCSVSAIWNFQGLGDSFDNSQQ